MTGPLPSEQGARSVLFSAQDLRWGLLAGMLGALIATWPLVLSLGELWPGHPGQEIGNHVWGLWAALQLGSPLGGPVDFVDYPDGLTYALVDPLHLGFFALGGGDPVWGYNLVILLGLVVVGISGYALARLLEVSPVWAVGAGVLVATCPQLVATLGDGQTEAVGVGWVGLSLVSLVSFIRDGGRTRGVLAALLLAAAWYAGPYNGIFASLIALAVGLVSVKRRPSLLVVGGAALVMVLPLAFAIFDRPEGLPGTASRAGALLPMDRAEGWRGGLAYGVDLFDLWVPLPLTGEDALFSHTGYLGLIGLALGCWAVYKKRSLWPWLAGVGVFAALALGPWLTVSGEVVRVGDRVVPGPAGALSMALPVFWRVTRWYRAAAIASLLLAPLVVWALSRAPRRLAVPLFTLCLLDALLLAPVLWPVPLYAPPETSGLDQLQEPGAVFMLPSSTFGQPPVGKYRDIGPLLQTWHGHPISGGLMGEEGWVPISGLLPDTARLTREGRMRSSVHAALLSNGFRYLMVLPDYRRFPGWKGNLTDCFERFEVENALFAVVDLQRFNEARCGQEGALPHAPSPKPAGLPLAQPPEPLRGRSRGAGAPPQEREEPSP